MKHLWIIAVVLTFAMPAATFAKSRVISTDYRLNFVKLETIHGKELKQKAPSHPTEVSVEKMRQMLASIRIHRKAFIKKGKFSFQDRHVFNEPSLDALTGPIVEGLQQAHENEVVVFSYLFKHGKSVMRNDRFSSGKAWIKDNQLHIEFVKLYARITADLNKRGYADKAVSKAKGVRIALETVPGQQLATNSKKELILDLHADFSLAGIRQAQTMQIQTPEERLKALKRLREMDLITQDEFEARRRTILGQL